MPQLVQELYGMIQLFTELDSSNQKKLLSVLEGLYVEKCSMPEKKLASVVKKKQNGISIQE